MECVVAVLGAMDSGKKGIWFFIYLYFRRDALSKSMRFVDKYKDYV